MFPQLKTIGMSYSEYGLSAGLYNNAYGLTGTLNDSDELWFDYNWCKIAGFCR